MLRFLLDTDHLTLYQYQHPPLMRQIAIHPAGRTGDQPDIHRGNLRPFWLLYLVRLRELRTSRPMLI